MRPPAANLPICAARPRSSPGVLSQPAYWLTIEVQHGKIPADNWRRAHGESLIEAAVTNGAEDWEWHRPGWGVILELTFREEQARDAFHGLPAVIAALDAVPDLIFGLLVYRGLAAWALESHGDLAPPPLPGLRKLNNQAPNSSTWPSRLGRQAAIRTGRSTGT